MKVIVISNKLNSKLIEMIQSSANEAGAEVCFVKDEKDVPEEFMDAEVILSLIHI